MRQSIMRKLLHKELKKVAADWDKNGKILDAGCPGKEYLDYLGFKNGWCCDIEGGDWVVDLNKDCGHVDNDFDYVLCLNTLLLIHDVDVAMDNIYSFLKKGGVALLDFHFLTYWYKPQDHWQNFTIPKIKELTKKFESVEIIPTGNYTCAYLNYITQQPKNRYIRKILEKVGGLCIYLKPSETTAVSYLAVCKK